MIAILASPITHHFIYIFILLVAGHALCDYPLQGDFLAKGKNPRLPIPGVPWQQCMAAHASIHGGMVLLATHSTGLATLEYLLHYWIDYAKCTGVFGDDAGIAFEIDQLLHWVCKFGWAIATVFLLHSA